MEPAKEVSASDGEEQERSEKDLGVDEKKTRNPSALLKKIPLMTRSYGSCLSINLCFRALRAETSNAQHQISASNRFQAGAGGEGGLCGALLHWRRLNDFRWGFREGEECHGIFALFSDGCWANASFDIDGFANTLDPLEGRENQKRCHRNQSRQKNPPGEIARKESAGPDPSGACVELAAFFNFFFCISYCPPSKRQS